MFNNYSYDINVYIVPTTEVTIRFERTELSMNESIGTFMMCVLKNRETIVPVTVDIQLVEGSATQDVGKNDV